MQIGEAISYGNSGDYIAVKLPNGKIVMAIAGNVINSSKVLVAGGYVWSETSPQVELIAREIFRSGDRITTIEESLTCQLFIGGIWQHRVVEWRGDIDYVSESWSYVRGNLTSLQNEYAHVCYNRGDGGGDYDDLASCMADNLDPLPERLLTYHTARVGHYADITNNLRRAADYYGEEYAPFYMNDGFLPVAPESNVVYPRTFRLEEAGDFRTFRPEALADSSVFMDELVRYRGKMSLTIHNEEGIWGERLTTKTYNLGEPNEYSETVHYRSYIDKETDADFEFGYLEEMTITGDWVPVDISTYSCSPIFIEEDNLGSINGEDAIVPAHNGIHCEKYIDIPFGAERTEDIYHYGYRMWYDSNPYSDLRQENDAYAYVALEMWLEPLRNVARTYTSKDYTHSYYFKLHAPINAKFAVDGSSPEEQLDLPMVKLIELYKPEIMRYYLTYLGNKAYFIAQIGKLRDPDLDFEERIWAKIRVIELEITATEIIIVSDEEYDAPEPIEPDLDNWQHHWVYAYTNELSGNICLDQLKFTEQFYAANDRFKEISVQENKQVRYNIEGNYSHGRIIGSDLKNTLLNEDESEIEITVNNYEDAENYCSLSKTKTITIKLPKVTLPQGDDSDWVLNELAVFSICTKKQSNNEANNP